ncbi:MAG: hypothetical protein GWM92_15800 [Gemmatimonadetes bacterium]|nr:hypothetical protein [Gemmatimonadota bacterium]NIR80196.1 hypothetical protein [Gemmatimonadota bacterium]NIT88958.1 hypothetical protein [Gemmatimonadota bacterium]NIU32753.1 hypothetical protein [Gemmatimonadota bacterium]NIU37185.1 hypothetical protein [Gemmatimonadota bacterium]
MIAALLERIGAKGMDPERLVRVALGSLPDHRRVTAAELGSFLGVLREVGPPPPPPWARTLFDHYGAELQVSPELLAALSWALVQWNPAGDGWTRRGLLGAPLELVTDGQPHGAELRELEDGDPGAAAAVRRGVEFAARHLQERADELGSMAAAAQEWIRQGAPVPDEADAHTRELLGATLLSFLVYVLREMGEPGPRPA